MTLGLVSDLGFAQKDSNSDASSQRGLAFNRSNKRGHSFLKAGNRFVRVPSEISHDSQSEDASVSDLARDSENSGKEAQEF